MQGKRADLREMYQEWPFFQSTIDLIEMILAKADMRIAALYDEQLVHNPSQRALGAVIRERFMATVHAVLQVLGFHHTAPLPPRGPCLLTCQVHLALIILTLYTGSCISPIQHCSLPAAHAPSITQCILP